MRLRSQNCGKDESDYNQGVGKGLARRRATATNRDEFPDSDPLTSAG
jgi:hypothetical protein